MTPQEFAYWLQGYSEINGQPPTAQQWQIIQDHLKLVFTKVTPNVPNVVKPSPDWRDSYKGLKLDLPKDWRFSQPMC